MTGPGNFRELRGVLTRALLAAADGHIDLDQVVVWLPAAPKTGIRPAATVLRAKMADEVVREFQRSGCNVSHTARNLAISRNTVYHHLRESAKRDSVASDGETSL